MSEFKTLFIKDLLLDQKYQARSRMDPQVIKDYEGLISEGVEMPPIKVVSIQNQLYVVDGFHRVYAYRNQGRDRIEADVVDGNDRLALELAVSANQAHGLRRSNQDKTKAVEMVLDDLELMCESDRFIAKLCGVSPPFVGDIRTRLEKPKSSSRYARKTHEKVESQEVKIFSPPTAFGEPEFDANAELVAQQLIAAVNASPNRMLRFIIPFLLLTGARKREVLNAQWRDVDAARSFWRIPITKSGRERHVPLSAAAITLLQRIPRTNKSEWVFVNPKTNKPYVSILYSWNTARTAAGLADVRLHDLRHSFASFLVNAGCSLYEVQKILGHASVNMTQRYSHLSQHSLLRAAEHAGNVVSPASA